MFEVADLCRSVVMVPDPELAVRLTKEASKVVPSLEDFRPEVWGLPPYKNDSKKH